MTYPWPSDVTDVLAVRRDLHAHPELGFTEIRTAARVEMALRALGWTIRSGRDVFDATGLPGLPALPVLESAADRALADGVSAELVTRLAGGHTAVIADLVGSRPGPRVALRFDLDALPITETDSADHRPWRHGFASCHAGVMHACGHDGHVAIGLALAAALSTHDFSGQRADAVPAGRGRSAWRYATAAVTDAAVAGAVTAAAEGLAEVRATHPLGASDDASLLMRAVQAAGGVAGYAIVGSDTPGPPHSPLFDVDEAVLPTAVSWLERAVKGGRW
jgi:metal-dependent amidase/aminoacylase/carboxypeptidase family protein